MDEGWAKSLPHPVPVAQERGFEASRCEVNRWRRHVKSEGPLKGPDGTSVAVDVTTDDAELVLWSWGEADSDCAIPHCPRSDSLADGMLL